MSLTRLAQPSDCAALALLRHALWPEASVEEHRAEIEAILRGQTAQFSPYAILVAVDDELIGFAEVGLRSHAEGCDATRPVAYFEGWYVVESRRRQGVGAALLRAAEEWARAEGCTELASDTWLDNEGAQRAHEALGFSVVESDVHYRKPLATSGDFREETLILAICSVAGATKACAARGDLPAVRVLTEWYDLAVVAVHAAGGRLLKVLGDGVLITFPPTRAREAVDALRDLQQRGTALWQAFHPDCRVQVRAAAGSVVVGQLAGRCDIYGDALNRLFRMSGGDFLLAPQIAVLCRREGSDSG